MPSFTRILGPMGKIADLASHLQSVLWAVNALRGGTVPDDAPAAIKALRSGVFGAGDEVAIQQAVLQLKADEAAYVWGILDYGYIKPAKSSLVGRIWAVMVLNKWRTIVGKLDLPGQKVGTVEKVKTVLDPAVKGVRTVETEKRDLQSDGNKLSLAFLRSVVKTIKTEEKRLLQRNASLPADQQLTPEQCREAGYQIVLAQFEAAGIPRMPSPETLAEIDNLLRNARGWIIKLILEGHAGLVKYIDDAHQKLEDRRAAELEAIWGSIPHDERTFGKHPLRALRAAIARLEQHT